MSQIAQEFDAASYFSSEATIAAYLEAAFEEGNMELIRAALRDVVRAKGVQWRMQPV